jgi:Activator of Hsp90 ATPase homolog 1-like protein
MASFDDTAETAAPPEEVFKLLYNPKQFSRWWGCMQIEGNPAPSKHPDFGLPRMVSSSQGDGRVTITCSLAEIVFDWRLEERPQGGTTIAVHVEVPDAYQLDLEGQEAVIGMSLRQLADVAAHDAAPA